MPKKIFHFKTKRLQLMRLLVGSHQDFIKLLNAMYLFLHSIQQEGSFA